MTTLWCASTNPGKLREFREAARLRRVDVRPLPGLAAIPPCVEDGETFEANARKKAAYYSGFTGEWVFADDSGLSVDAIGGAPGVMSARYAGPHATDAENNARLIAELRRRLGSDGGERGGEPNDRRPDHPAPLRAAAHYVCVVALARQGRILEVTAGEAAGCIIEQPRGSGGFGYDPYFFYPPLGCTFAELTAEAKFAVSHRGAAFRKLLDAIRPAPDDSAGEKERTGQGRQSRLASR